MATVRPFRAFRPRPEFAAEVAAKPYDVLNSNEAREEVKGHPLSFLHIGKPEVDLDPSIDLYDPRVYEKGRENLQKLIGEGVLLQDSTPCLYLYAQTMGEHTQYGIVGCAAVEEYWNDTIKKHEFTRKDKEEDRSNHVRVTNAHTGPIFLTYPDRADIDEIVDRVRSDPSSTDHIAADGIRHQTWVISDESTITRLRKLFADLPNLYVADGHHRSAAAAIVGRERAQANSMHTGDEEYNFYLAVVFPAGQLRIMDYNRLVKDLNGLSEADFMAKLGENFTVRPADGQVRPPSKGTFGMYFSGKWYLLAASNSLLENTDPVQRLDVAIMQNFILGPILGIQDPRTDKRIDFVGGIRGLDGLERRVNSGEMTIAFSMYPTSIRELMAIADAGQVMPPKSTWFEPKLSDGLFVHFLD
jgi:uncharacterized protein (DUF1015 family)